MNNPEPSAKILQTRKFLAQHLKCLLEDRNFKKITVNDICQHSMISRSTFYLHFEDKYSLLRYCLKQEMSQWAESSKTLDLHNYLIFVLNDILKKKKFYENTLVNANDHELYEIFFTEFSKFFTTKLDQIFNQEQMTSCPISIISAFYVGGITCSIIQWIKKDFSLPVEEIAQCHEKLLYSGMSGIIQEKL